MMLVGPRRIELDAGIVRAVLGPLALMAFTPPATIILWLLATRFGGSPAALLEAMRESGFIALIPRPTMTGLAIVLGFSLLQYVLLVALPGAKFLGPVTPTGAQPEYKLNGVAAWFVTHGLLIGGYATGVLSMTALYDELGGILTLLNVGALLFCLFLYWKGRIAPSSSDAVLTGNPLFDFFQGVELHPRAIGVSLKQLINCRISMMGWSVMCIAYSAWEIETRGRLSPALFASTFLVVVYLFKFFWWESGYFASLDIMHDRFGFYICWGVLVWVPAVYTLPTMYIAANPSSLSWTGAVAIIVLGLFAIYANYAADAQRQRVRATNGRALVWGKPAKVLRVRYTQVDGKERESILLVSGYWGIARHSHYVAELTAALAWTLPAGLAPVAYVYFVFLTVLLFDRARRDDRRCRAKYGSNWNEYCRMVPYRIIPGIY
jgi:7-dehydrocholesterol reductase